MSGQASGSLARPLLAIALHAAMPFAFALCPIVNESARVGSIDWIRMMPVLLPVVSGAALVGALFVIVASRSRTRRGLVFAAAGFALGSPFLSSLVGALLAAIVSGLSLGHIQNLSPYWSLMWLPLSMLEAPAWTFALCLLLAAATAISTLPSGVRQEPDAATRRTSV